jgi:flagellar export protein FliJ
MGRFIFRLQKVLDHRAQIEDEKKQFFMKARIEYMREKAKLETLQNELRELNLKTTPPQSDVFIYIARYNYKTLLEERIEDQVIKVDLYEEEMNKKKAEFNESRKDRKVVDKLREKALANYNAEADALEQKQNDEFALYGHMRK